MTDIKLELYENLENNSEDCRSCGHDLGTNVDATDADSRNAFVIIVLSAIVAISLCMPDSGKEEMA